MSEQPQSVRLSSWNWIGLIAMMAGAVGTFYAVQFQNNQYATTLIEKLDTKWQQRVSQMVDDVKHDIAEVKADVDDVRSSIPPEWFRKMVEANQAMINENTKRMNELDKQITKLIAVIENGVD